MLYSKWKNILITLVPSRFCQIFADHVVIESCTAGAQTKPPSCRFLVGLLLVVMPSDELRLVLQSIWKWVKLPSNSLWYDCAVGWAIGALIAPMSANLIAQISATGWQEGGSSARGPVYPWRQRHWSEIESDLMNKIFQILKRSLRPLPTVSFFLGPLNKKNQLPWS